MHHTAGRRCRDAARQPPRRLGVGIDALHHQRRYRRERPAGGEIYCGHERRHLDEYRRRPCGGACRQHAPAAFQHRTARRHPWAFAHRRLPSRGPRRHVHRRVGRPRRAQQLVQPPQLHGCRLRPSSLSWTACAAPHHGHRWCPQQPLVLCLLQHRVHQAA